MTENVGPVPGAPYAPPPQLTPRPPLRRSRTDRVVGGVAGGFGRWLGIDPVIVRVVLVVLAIFGGSGLLLYAAGWLFIPEDGESSNEAERLLDRSGTPGSAGRVIFAVVAVVVGIILVAGLASAGPWHGFLGFGGGSALLLLLAAGAVVVWLANRTPGSALTVAAGPVVAPPAAPEATMTFGTAAMATGTAVQEPVAASTEPGFAYGGHGGYPGYVAPTPAPTPPPAPTPRSYLGLATVSLALIVMGILGSLQIAGVATIPAVVTLSAGLGVLGLGLLVGSFLGRARWLIAIALPLLLVIALVALIPANLKMGNGIGERVWIPTTVAEAAGPRSLGVGDAELDLTEMAIPAGSAVYPVQASVGIGQLRVLVPDGVNVMVTANVDLGEIDVQGVPRRNGPDQQVITDLPGFVPESAPTLDLVVDVAIGNLEVSRA